MESAAVDRQRRSSTTNALERERTNAAAAPSEVATCNSLEAGYYLVQRFEGKVAHVDEKNGCKISVPISVCFM